MKLLEENGSMGKYRCVCGTEKWTNKYAVRDGRTKSCGCLKSELLRVRNTRHGGSGTSEYNAWLGMHSRCYNRRNAKYRVYGNRGIQVCNRWGRFEKFIEDMGAKPSKNHSLERINVDKDYRPSNCRWATAVEQARNKTNSVTIFADGRSMTLQEWSEKTGIDRRKISDRLKYGWSAERALGLK